jgi:UDP-N-acetylmuramate-alanine ligase
LLVIDVPHTYSRTLTFLDDYRDVFAAADLVILGPIEAARERHLATTVSSEDVAERVRASGVECLVVPGADTAIATAVQRAQPGDVVLCISVGGFDNVAARLLQALGTHHG